MSLPVALLAGGLATRLRPLTEQIPKILIDIGGEPFAAHQMALLRRQGVTDVVLCVGHLGEQVQAALGNGDRWSMRLRYVFDGPRLLGTGGALRRALPLLGPAFYVMYGDSYLTYPFAPIQAAFDASGQPALMTVFRNENQWDRSNIAFADGRIVKYDKRSDDPSLRYIDYGLGIVTPEVFDAWPDTERPLDLADVYSTLVSEGRMAGFEVPERFYEIGSHAGLEETRALLAGRGASL